MGHRKHISIWLKRRRNPPRKDGSRTVSYTLQWRDENYEERFDSLGAAMAEEEAEAKRQHFEQWINGDWGDDPVLFIEQMSQRNQRAIETLKRTAGDDPRRWPLQEMFGDKNSEWDIRFEEFVRTLQSRPQDHPETLLRQFQTQHPMEHEVLLDLLETEEGLLKNVKRLLLFHGGETVWKVLLHYAKEWQWSDDPSRFVEQFRTRYPSEFDAIEKDLPIEERLKGASLPPREIAKRLLDFARGELDIEMDDAPSPGRSIVMRSEIE